MVKFQIKNRQKKTRMCICVPNAKPKSTRREMWRTQLYHCECCESQMTTKLSGLRSQLWIQNIYSFYFAAIHTFIKYIACHDHCWIINAVYCRLYLYVCVCQQQWEKRQLWAYCCWCVPLWKRLIIQQTQRNGRWGNQTTNFEEKHLNTLLVDKK